MFPQFNVRLLGLLLTIFCAVISSGCRTHKYSLTAPEATLIIHCDHMPRSHFWEVRHIINNSVKNHTTHAFEHDKTYWKERTGNENGGTCVVRFNSEVLNRAEVIQQASTVRDVIARRLKLGGYEKRTSLTIQ